jgi:predicted nucleic acid-binding protein
MPEVISDTSPIQYLHQAGLLHILPALYTRLILPQGVVGELETGRSRGVELPDVSVLSWIEVRRVANLPFLRLSPDLGHGEKEVLALGLECSDSLVILDDALARRHAGLLEIPCTGTVGVLLKAKREGCLLRIAPVIHRLTELGFHLSAATRDAALDLAEESA